MTAPAAYVDRVATHRASLVNGLVDAVQSERRLVEELTAIMLQQRAAVASEDLQSVDDSVYAVQRVLFTLAEARKRRRSLNVHLGHDEEIALRQLVEAIGPLATDALRTARDQLHAAARTLAREVAVNRQVLRESLSAGDEYVRALTGAITPKVGYGEALGSREVMRGARIMNRQA
jgi:hypothetical protein